MYSPTYTFVDGSPVQASELLANCEDIYSYLNNGITALDYQPGRWAGLVTFKRGEYFPINNLHEFSTGLCTGTISLHSIGGHASVDIARASVTRSTRVGGSTLDYHPYEQASTYFEASYSPLPLNMAFQLVDNESRVGFTFLQHDTTRLDYTKCWFQEDSQFGNAEPSGVGSVSCTRNAPAWELRQHIQQFAYTTDTAEAHSFSVQAGYDSTTCPFTEYHSSLQAHY